MNQSIRLNAIRDRDLKSVLEPSGISHQIDEGICDCESCGKEIIWENIGAITTEKGTDKLTDLRT